MSINTKQDQMCFYTVYVKEEIEGNTVLQKMGKFELDSHL